MRPDIVSIIPRMYTTGSALSPLNHSSLGQTYSPEGMTQLTHLLGGVAAAEPHEAMAAHRAVLKDDIVESRAERRRSHRDFVRNLFLNSTYEIYREFQARFNMYELNSIPHFRCMVDGAQACYYAGFELGLYADSDVAAQTVSAVLKEELKKNGLSLKPHELEIYCDYFTACLEQGAIDGVAESIGGGGGI